MQSFGKGLCLFCLFLMLGACGQRDGLAPVTELKWTQPGSTVRLHRVVRGETLYAIAFRYDKDYRQLAQLNRLDYPYLLQVGQVLRVRQTAGNRTPPRFANEPAPNQTVAPKLHPAKPKKSSGSLWLWPAQGRIINQFVPAKGQKGINIAGKEGDKIYASSGGVVAYAGNGLSGYGNLIILKHDQQFLTAYGNNSRTLVKEGQKVRAGQMIAEMGRLDRRNFGVHFEVRKAGQPVNPLNYLKKG